MTDLSGIIPVIKPENISSNKVVSLIKKKFNIKKAGHTGTLDPFASGMLPVCINRGTKIVRYLISEDKEYRGIIKLGTATDTMDRTGKVVTESDPGIITPQDIIDACSSFTGKILQLPPVFSALKHKGKPLYKYAREGNPVQKPPREIEIYQLTMEEAKLPYITINVKCSSGTYIRTLASDIAEKLGTAGHLSELQRRACGRFHMDSGFHLEEILEMENLTDIIIDIKEAIPEMGEKIINQEFEHFVMNGRKIDNSQLLNPQPCMEEDTPFKVINGEGTLLAIARKEKDQTFFTYDAVFN